MKIKKNGWIDKIAYGLNAKCPEHTNLCKLFWRTLFMLFIGWPLTLVLIAVALFVAYAIGFFMASKPTIGMSMASEKAFVPIEKWPKIMGHRIWPINVISLCAIVCVAWQYVPAAAMAVTGWLSVNVSMAMMIFVGALLIIALGYAIRKFFESELWELAKAYISAKKQKICPIVEFVD